MKRWKDPFPRTPKGFHDRVEQTLSGLEDMKMRRNNNYRKLNVALIAALIAILATTAVAVAVVLGNARFKQALTDGGADEVAELVQEVHMPAAESEDFRRGGRASGPADGCPVRSVTPCPSTRSSGRTTSSISPIPPACPTTATAT